MTIVTGIFPPDIGGPASFVPLFAEALVKRNIELVVVTVADDPEALINEYPFPIKIISRKIPKFRRILLVVKSIVKCSGSSQVIFSNTMDFEAAIAAKLLRIPHIQKVVGDLAWERACLSGRFNGSIDEYQLATHSWKSKLTDMYRSFPVVLANQIITPSEYLKKIVLGWHTNASVKKNI